VASTLPVGSSDLMHSGENDRFCARLKTVISPTV
jgi:hypothetical protein